MRRGMDGAFGDKRRRRPDHGDALVGRSCVRRGDGLHRFCACSGRFVCGVVIPCGSCRWGGVGQDGSGAFCFCWGSRLNRRVFWGSGRLVWGRRGFFRMCFRLFHGGCGGRFFCCRLGSGWGSFARCLSCGGQCAVCRLRRWCFCCGGAVCWRCLGRRGLHGNSTVAAFGGCLVMAARGGRCSDARFARRFCLSCGRADDLACLRTAARTRCLCAGGETLWQRALPAFC